MKLLCMLLAVSAFAQTRDSIEKQLKSVQRQKDALLKMWPEQQAGAPQGSEPQGGEPGCKPMSEEQVTPLIDEAARAQALPPKLLRAVIAQESGFRSCAVSEKGAQGLMQLMPATARELRVEDPFDPKANIAAGATFLRRLLEKYQGDLAQALAAYNAGPDTVEKAGGVPDIPETRSYVASLLEKIGSKRVDLPPVPPAAPPSPPVPPAPVSAVPAPVAPAPVAPVPPAPVLSPPALPTPP